MRSRPTLIRLAWASAALLAIMSAVPFVQAAEIGPGGGSASEVRLQAGRGGTFSAPVANLLPGDSVTQAVVVENDGSGDLRYSVSISGEDPDGKGLRDIIAVSVGILDDPTTGSCDAFAGPAVFAGTLGAGGGLGDPRPGSHDGDRTLRPGATEVLCLRITLPLEADNAYQGARTSASLGFSAEQVQDNG